MTTVGIVGCGTIGSALAKTLDRELSHVARLVALADKSRLNALRLQRQLTSHPPIVSLSELIRRSQLVIEAASASVAAQVARHALAANRDVLIMSTGGLLTDGAAWPRAARRSRGRLYVPSGAVPGLDGIKAMAVGTIRKITLTTRKPPGTWASAPFVKTRRLNLTRLKRPTTLFEGSPAQAVKAFPQNLNVAATIALACRAPVQNQRRGGTRKLPPMRIRIVADPTIRVNVHELNVEGDCGRLQCRIESWPAVTNPRTSELAVRSALATLHQLFNPVRIGT